MVWNGGKHEGSHLECGACGATPAGTADTRQTVDAAFGYLVGSDCPACSEGALRECETCEEDDEDA